MTISYDETTGRYMVAELTRNQIRHLLTQIKENIMTKQRHFKVTITETSGKVVKTEIVGNYDREGVIKFYGLREPDVLYYKIEEVTDEE